MGVHLWTQIRAKIGSGRAFAPELQVVDQAFEKHGNEYH